MLYVAAACYFGVQVAIGPHGPLPRQQVKCELMLPSLPPFPTAEDCYHFWKKLPYQTPMDRVNGITYGTKFDCIAVEPYNVFPSPG